MKSEIAQEEINKRAKGIFNSWFDGLITEDEAIADAILKGCGKELKEHIKSYKSQHKIASPSRKIKEIETFTRLDLAELAKSAAKLKIIGSYYKGDFESQKAKWEPDGSITIITTHSPQQS